MHLRHELVSRLLGLNQDFVPPDSEQDFVNEATELYFRKMALGLP
jgi:hypothetical protein